MSSYLIFYIKVHKTVQSIYAGHHRLPLFAPTWSSIIEAKLKYWFLIMMWLIHTTVWIWNVPPPVHMLKVWSSIWCYWKMLKTFSGSSGSSLGNCEKLFKRAMTYSISFASKTRDKCFYFTKPSHLIYYLNQNNKAN